MTSPDPHAQSTLDEARAQTVFARRIDDETLNKWLTYRNTESISDYNGGFPLKVMRDLRDERANGNAWRKRIGQLQEEVERLKGAADALQRMADEQDKDCSCLDRSQNPPECSESAAGRECLCRYGAERLEEAAKAIRGGA